MREALTIRFYQANRFESQFFHGQINHYADFRKQIERFRRTLECKASQQDIECVCAENVITKAKLYNFSKN